LQIIKEDKVQPVSHYNSVHVNYLTPLLKWRILDLETLRRKCIGNPKYAYFARIIQKLEQAKLVKTYKHPFCRKKYIFLSPLGESQFACETSPTSLSQETIAHDLIASQVTQSFLNEGLISDASLEHQLHSKRSLNSTFRTIPDALFTIESDGRKYHLAFELELSQKKKERVAAKVREYMLNSSYDYIVYFFTNESILRTYSRVIYEVLPKEKSDRFMFFYDPELTVNKVNLDNISGLFRGKKVSLIELFSKFNTEKKSVEHE
jgi:DNA-binding MarR family transcriptional regulator